MKRIKQTLRILSLVLCALTVLPLFFTAASEKNTASAVSDPTQTVRVGLAAPELGTAIFLACAVNTSGFSVGTVSDSTFSGLFDLSATAIAILPDRNAEITYEDGIASGRASDSGNYGAYNLRTDRLYTSYSEAKTAANRLTDGFVARVNGGYEVRFGSYRTENEAKAVLGNKSGSVASPAGGLSVIDCTTGKILLEYEHTSLFALRAKNGGEVSLNNSSGRKSYLGFFSFEATAKLKIINYLDLETYVKCVMANEIGTNATVETRRAFSVLVRTVPMTQKHAEYGFDVCCFSCCQVYHGTYRRDAENDAIVDSTRGEYVSYEGEPISCLYHNSNGGASCSSVAAWGGAEIPYLTSVTLQEDGENTSEIWQYTFTESELYDFLSSRAAFDGLENGISDVTVEATDPYGSGYVTLLSVTDRSNNVVQIETSEKVRTALRFDSANFTVSYSMNATVLTEDGTVETAAVGGYVDGNGNYVAFDSFEELPVAGTDSTAGADHILFDGIGTGHGVGFSSVGSEQLVAQGYSYRYILGFYFPGTEISKISR